MTLDLTEQVNIRGLTIIQENGRTCASTSSLAQKPVLVTRHELLTRGGCAQVYAARLQRIADATIELALNKEAYHG